VATVVLACCLAALAGVLLAQLRGDFQSIGQRDAPEAGATTGLYFALNDMDAQVANVLLVGGDTALAGSRAQDLATYARDRADADTDLQQATAAEADNAAAVVRFGGYLGAEFRNIAFTGERRAAVAALLAFQRYERDDRTLRALATRNLAAAVSFDTGTAPSQSDGAFNQYDAALSSVIAINSGAFTSAVAGGEDGAVGWEAGFPALGLVLIVALTYAGVRPRLDEYR
jgi:hypothetical protein